MHTEHWIGLILLSLMFFTTVSDFGGEFTDLKQLWSSAAGWKFASMLESFCIVSVQSAAIMGGLCCSLVNYWGFIPETWRCELHVAGIGKKYGNMPADIKAAPMTWGTAEDQGRQNDLSSAVYWDRPPNQTLCRNQVLFQMESNDSLQNMTWEYTSIYAIWRMRTAS